MLSTGDFKIIWNIHMGETKFLQNLWEKEKAEALAARPLELLQYRSNLLGADLRITNFGGGNTSSKFDLPDPLSGKPARVLAVKGSGGDLRSIKTSGFAVLYMDKLEQLIPRYRGEEFEDEIVTYYPLCAFGENRVAASIDTPLHAFLPYDHVDHLHPDWCIALAASANGKKKLEEFNKRFGRKMVWLPWQRPGFELAMMLRRAVAENPGCDGIVLGSHGLFTWGDTQQTCYESSIQTIDRMGEFIGEHPRRAVFGGVAVDAAANLDDAALDDTAGAILPYLRGILSSNRRVIAHYEGSKDALEFANSKWAEDLCRMGTSCPDHFLRTRICPMFIPWNPAAESIAGLRARIDERVAQYREGYGEYYKSCATADSPKLRDTNPAVVVIAGLGVFGFGKDKREARITTEFFVNAIHVMRGANELEESAAETGALPQARHAEQARQFSSFHNYVALPRTEAFRIEYWALEEAKLQRMPAEREFSRGVFLVVGGGSGIGRETALQIALKGGHVVVADRDRSAAECVAKETGALGSGEMTLACELDLTCRESIQAALRAAVLKFGGVDAVVNTAAVYPVPAADTPPETVWSQALSVNVTGNFLLAQETAAILKAQNLPAAMVFASSANAVVPKHGSEPYDTSKAALSHLIRELAVGLGPLVRVNGIAPATVVEGSAMFPRDRVMGSLRKYGIEFTESESTEALRSKLAGFYAQRTITRRPILPADCANAICWLLGEQSAKTTGHVIPVDGGLTEAFLR